MWLITIQMHRCCLVLVHGILWGGGGMYPEPMTLTLIQVKVREATSNDPWGPSSTQMSEIADLTYNMVSSTLTNCIPQTTTTVQSDFSHVVKFLTPLFQVAFSEIMQMIWKRLNDHGKNWRHVYKALVLLEYLIKTGSEKVGKVLCHIQFSDKFYATFSFQ